MEGGRKGEAPHEMFSTWYSKDTDSDECFGQLGGTTGPELVGCSSVKEKRGKDKEKVKSVKEVEQLKLYSHRILAFHYFM